MTSSMEIVQIRYLLIAAEELNLHRAAERMQITQPALTKQIGALEAELGFDVFVRDGRRLIGLTRAGEKFVADVAKALRSLDDTVLETQKIAQGAVGRLRIGVSEGVVSVELAHVLRQCRRAMPHVEFAVSEMRRDEQVRAVRDNELDLALMDVPVNATGLGVEGLWLQGRAVLLPEGHALAQMAHVTVAQLLESSLAISGCEVSGSEVRVWDDSVIADRRQFGPRVTRALGVILTAAAWPP